MQEFFDNNEFEEQEAQRSAKEFEKRFKNKELYFIDLMKVDEIYHYYLSLGELRKATQLVRFALQTHPTSGELYFKLARLDYELGKFDPAIELMDTALQYSPLTPEYVYFQSDLLARRERFSEALELLQQLRAITDKPAEVYLQMGNICQICGEIEKSQTYYEKALEIKTDYEDALYELGFLLESDDRHDDAITLYQAFLEEYPYTHLAWYNLAVLHQKQGNFELAIDALDFATVIDGNFAQAYLNKGELLLDLGQTQKALQVFLEANSVREDDIPTLYHLAECYESLEMYHDAQRYYKYVSQLDPDYIDAWVGIGFCLERRERFLEAIHFYQKAYLLDEDNADICLSIAVCEYKLGNRHSAYTFLEKAVSIAPSDPHIWHDWSELLFQYGNFTGAITYLEEGIKLNPGLAELYYQCSAYCYESGIRSKGEIYLENALLLDFDRHDYLFQIAPSLKGDKRIEMIIRQYQ